MVATSFESHRRFRRPELPRYRVLGRSTASADGHQDRARCIILIPQRGAESAVFFLRSAAAYLALPAIPAICRSDHCRSAGGFLGAFALWRASTQRTPRLSVHASF